MNKRQRKKKLFKAIKYLKDWVKINIPDGIYFSPTDNKTVQIKDGKVIAESEI